MIEPGYCVLHRLNGWRIRRRGAAHHDDANTQRAGGGDLAVGGGAAAVFGNKNFDAVGRHERAIVGLAERAAGGDIGGVRQRQRRINRIDASDQIMVLGRIAKGRKLVASDCDEHAPGSFANRRDCLGSIFHVDPAVAGHGGPSGPPKCDEWYLRVTRRGNGIFRDDGCIWMGGVDQATNAMFGEIGCQTCGAAETADADRHGVRDRRRGAAGKRQRHVEIMPGGEAFAENPPFSGAAKNEDACHAAA